MIGLTAATGRLGRLVIAELLQRVPPDRVVARARDLNRASDLAAQGITVRLAHYDDPARLDAALRGIQCAHLGQRGRPARPTAPERHRYRGTRVQLLADTSLLHADRSPLRFLAHEHPAPEHALQESGLS
jgi:NAD(P)H dehydrogenase (quinone)